MENSSPLISWFSKHKQEYGISLMVSAWPKLLGIPLFRYRTMGAYQGSLINGYGTDEKKLLAIEKSIAEFIERICVFSNGLKSTNGCAAYFTKEVAKGKALEELIERHLFLCSFYTRSAHSISMYENKSLRGIAHLIKSYQGIKTYDVCFGKIGNTFSCGTIMLGMNHAIPFGVIVGLASGSKLHLAFEKSREDCLSALMNFIFSNSKSQSEGGVENDSIVRSVMASSVDYGHKFKEEYVENLVIEPKTFSPLQQTAFTDLNIPLNFSASPPPLAVVQAKDPMAQFGLFQVIFSTLSIPMRVLKQIEIVCLFHLIETLETHLEKV